MDWAIIPLGLFALIAYLTLGYALGYCYWWMRHHSWGKGNWWRKILYLFAFPITGGGAYWDQYVKRDADWEKQLESANDSLLWYSWDPEESCKVMAVIWPLAFAWTGLWIIEGLSLGLMLAGGFSIVGALWVLYKIGTWPARKLFRFQCY